MWSYIPMLYRHPTDFKANTQKNLSLVFLISLHVKGTVMNAEGIHTNQTPCSVYSTAHIVSKELTVFYFPLVTGLAKL